MAFVPTFEWWSMEDVYAAASILQDYTSGSVTSLVTGLRGEGQAINLPSSLQKDCITKQVTTGQAEMLFHAYVQYNQDNNPFLTLRIGGANANTFAISSGTITIKRQDGTTIGSFAAGWGIGEKHWISFAITLANTATGKLKLWLDGTAVINTSSLQTVNAAASVQGQGVVLNGLGVWDYIGLVIGSGGWVDADVPIQKRVRAVMASATTNVLDPDAPTFWTLYGSAGSRIAAIQENPVDTTNGIENTVGNNSIPQDIAMGSAAADTVFPVWGVQHFYNMVENTSTGRQLTIRTCNSGGFTAGGGIPTAGAFFFTTNQYFHMFYAICPRGSTAWTSVNYASTQVQLVVGP